MSSFTPCCKVDSLPSKLSSDIECHKAECFLATLLTTAAEPWLPVQDVSWRLMPGQRVGLVGANGCGKSTLLRCLAGYRKVQLRMSLPLQCDSCFDFRKCAPVSVASHAHFVHGRSWHNSDSLHRFLFCRQEMASFRSADQIHAHEHGQQCMHVLY